jgi:6-phosphogluconolactonase
MGMSGMGRMPIGGVVLLAISLGLTGCGAFFQCEGKASCPAGGGGTTTGDYAYVSNSALGSAYLNGYELSSGTLVTATDFPLSLAYIPGAMATTPTNSFLYVASFTTTDTGEIFAYSIGTGGALTQVGTNALVSESVSSMDISPDGKWLLALDTNGFTVTEYEITTATGELKVGASYGYSGVKGGAVNPLEVKFAPSGDFFVLALGTGGGLVYSFDTSTGVGTQTTMRPTGGTAVGINAVDADSNGYIYAAGTAGLNVYSTNAAGDATIITTAAYPTATGGSNSVVISTTNKYVYTGNEKDGSISGFSIGTDGVLTSLGANYPGQTGVAALGRDNSGSYIFAAGSNATSGFQVLQIGSTGALTVANTAAATVTSLPIVMALTH